MLFCTVVRTPIALTAPYIAQIRLGQPNQAVRAANQRAPALKIDSLPAQHLQVTDRALNYMHMLKFSQRINSTSEFSKEDSVLVRAISHS